jgi:hypothetical protein
MLLLLPLLLSWCMHCKLFTTKHTTAAIAGCTMKHLAICRMRYTYRKQHPKSAHTTWKFATPAGI